MEYLPLNGKIPFTKAWQREGNGCTYEEAKKYPGATSVGLKTGRPWSLVALDFDNSWDECPDKLKTMGFRIFSPRENSGKIIFEIDDAITLGTIELICLANEGTKFSFYEKKNLDFFWGSGGKQVAIEGVYPGNEKYGVPKGQYRNEGDLKIYDRRVLKDYLFSLLELKNVVVAEIWKDLTTNKLGDCFSNYDEWWKIICRISGTLHQKNYADKERYVRLAIEWSKLVPNFVSEDDVRKKFLSIKNNKGDRNATYISQGRTLSLYEKFLSVGFDKLFRFNQLTKEVEMTDYLREIYPNVIDSKTLLVQICKRHGINFKLQDFEIFKYGFAVENSYHPIKDYLESTRSLSPQQNPDWSRIFPETFLSEENKEMLNKTLIASVARVYEPGIKKDECLVLKGNQGIGKSTFFRTLFGSKFFGDTTLNFDKDTLMYMHRVWCNELAELETVTGKKESGHVKAFLSRSEDIFRKPYAVREEVNKRTFILVASVNKESFLVDETGNRRFWVVHIENVDNKYVYEARDKIWSWALSQYEAGVPIHLDFNVDNSKFEIVDPWEETIIDLIRDNTTSDNLVVRIPHLLDKVLFVPRERQNKNAASRLAGILKKLGFSSTQRKIDGRNTRVWVFVKG